MKLSRIKFPLIALVCGALALAVRIWLYRTGIDGKGLVVSGHPAAIISYVLMALVPAALLVCALPVPGNLQYPFRSTVLPFAGACLGAAGLFYTAIAELLSHPNTLGTLSSLLGLVAGCAMVLAGIARLRRGRPSYLLHAIVTIYFIVHILSQYQVWNIESQLQYYLPQLFASVFLMLSAYYRAHLDNGGNGVRFFLLFNYAATFFCAMAICGTAPVFYIAMLLWTVTVDCTLLPVKDDCNETDETP